MLSAVRRGWSGRILQRSLGLATGLVLMGVGVSGCDAVAALRGADVGKVEIAGNPLDGQRLLAQYQCGTCHVIPDVPASRGKVGPSLAAFGSRSYLAGSIPNGAGVLARFIVAPSDVVPGTKMPSMGVSSFDARDMAAYLGTLR